MASAIIQVKFFCIILLVQMLFSSCLARPMASENRPIRGLNYHFNPDGSVSGSFSASNAINNPMMDQSFGVSETFNFGPKGASMSGGQTGSVQGHFPGGNNFGFDMSNTNANSAGPGGFSSSGGNAFSNNIQNPFFSSSNANANAFANSFKLNNPFG